MSLDRAKILQNLKNSFSVTVYDEIDSTNNEAKRRYLPDSSLPELYVSDIQTAGRGRRGHSFYSPKGTGLYMTLALPLGARQREIQPITCAAGVAVCEAIASLSPHRPQIKWVNDIYLGDKKVVGILTELLSDGQNQPYAVIIGIGLNLTTTDFPDDFAARAGNLGDIEPNRLCAAIADRLIEYTHTEDDSGIIRRYAALNLCIGRQVSYNDEEGVHTATAVDIAPDGSLIVEENGAERSLHSGEISVAPK